MLNQADIGDECLNLSQLNYYFENGFKKAFTESF